MSAAETPALPNPLPRPPGELEELERVWARPRGIRRLTEVNNSVIGLYYIGTAVMFFVFAGVLALLMRTQLALPESELVGNDLYNQLFTMHGTVMMFLFAVPAVEAMGVILLPSMIAARDLPFPRLSAYSFWAYAIGGTVFLVSLFLDVAPRAGWFMYPPLSSAEYTPGVSADFWLLGIGFIEISAIAGAIELIVGVLRTRAPGMSLDKMPVFAWVMLVFAGMIVFAFPAMIAGTALLELERAFDWPFFIAERGGDPLLWQHLFWFFGHPEVYIIFLPAAGFVSMIVPTLARQKLVAYRLVVLAVVGTAFLSFGLWVHHMFTTGLPAISMSFFSAASMAVAIPSGIQVFAWIATIATGRVKLTTPGLFVLGFLVIFTIGGLSGVMVAMVPFDTQTHDTYFIVAHLHYVLIGGMVFPLFAAIYYWAPMVSQRRLSERLGKVVATLMFIGVNLAFFPMHITGLMGMPRRVYTYPDELGWGTTNLLSTIGAFIIAASVALFLFDLVRNLRPTAKDNAGNVWDAGTLEWLPTGNYQTRSIPIVTSREPLWDQPNLAADVEAGRYYLPGSVTGLRETIITSSVDAQPQYIQTLPGPGWSPFLSAALTAVAFMLLTVKAVVPALVCGALAIAGIIVWMWRADIGPRPAADIGGGLRLPINITGRNSHATAATVVLILCAGTLFGCLLFGYFFLWTVNDPWPPTGLAQPDFANAAIAAVLLGIASLAVRLGRTALTGHAETGPRRRFRLLLVLATVAVIVAVGLDGWSLWDAGLRPAGDAYGAIVFAIVGYQGFLVATLAIMTALVFARSLAGRIGGEWRSSFEVTALFGHYVVIQGLVALVVTRLFPLVAA